MCIERDHYFSVFGIVILAVLKKKIMESFLYTSNNNNNNNNNDDDDNSRTFHGCLEIQNFSSRVKIYFTFSLCSLVKFLMSRCSILYIL